MLHSRRLGLALTLAGCLAYTGCQATPAENPGAAGDDVVRLTAAKGIPMAEFLELGKSVTGKTFRFAAQESKPITFVGTMQIRKAEFLTFMRTMLRIQGFELVAKNEGAAEVLHVQRVQQREVIKLEHANARAVLATLKKNPPQPQDGRRMVAVAHASSNAILLSGSREQITAAKDLIARLDRPRR